MPGGADVPYCQALDGHGNKLIRGMQLIQCQYSRSRFEKQLTQGKNWAVVSADFVEAGGAYLGLCAGAYYACARIEFELGTRYALPG